MHLTRKSRTSNAIEVKLPRFVNKIALSWELEPPNRNRNSTESPVVSAKYDSGPPRRNIIAQKN